jgi:hypothetical protein
MFCNTPEEEEEEETVLGNMMIVYDLDEKGDDNKSGVL